MEFNVRYMVEIIVSDMVSVSILTTISDMVGVWYFARFFKWLMYLSPYYWYGEFCLNFSSYDRNYIRVWECYGEFYHYIYCYCVFANCIIYVYRIVRVYAGSRLTIVAN